MHLPSRGLRLSATTIRNTGVFLVPTRFMRIFTDINFSKGRGNYLSMSGFASLDLNKNGRLPSAPFTALLCAMSRPYEEILDGAMICPDPALVTAATGKLFLAVEIISRDDHHADTVVKKEVYDQIRIPRLWMVDPRYDNVEVYHSFEFGLQLKGILGGREVLTEKLVPQFQMVITDLFTV